MKTSLLAKPDISLCRWKRDLPARESADKSESVKDFSLSLFVKQPQLHPTALRQPTLFQNQEKQIFSCGPKGSP